MKRWPFYLFILWLFFYSPMQLLADNRAMIEKLEKISDEALQLVKVSRYDDALRLLQYFSDEFLVYTMYEGDFSVSDKRLISLLNEEAFAAVSDINLSHEEKVKQVTKFRLAIDAAANSSQPLWREMKEPIMGVLMKIEAAIENQDSSALHSELNSFLSLYDVVYPSLKFNISIDQLQKIDTRVVFLDHYRSNLLTDSTSRNELHVLQQDLEAIFDNIVEDEADPSLWWVIIMTGSIIIVTLSYVGYKKFQAEKEREKERKRRRDRGNLFDYDKKNR